MYYCVKYGLRATDSVEWIDEQMIDFQQQKIKTYEQFWNDWSHFPICLVIKKKQLLYTKFKIEKMFLKKKLKKYSFLLKTYNENKS